MSALKIQELQKGEYKSYNQSNKWEILSYQILACIFILINYSFVGVLLYLQYTQNHPILYEISIHFYFFIGLGFFAYTLHSFFNHHVIEKDFDGAEKHTIQLGISEPAQLDRIKNMVTKLIQLMYLSVAWLGISALVIASA
jgi:hypothetical protein